MSRGIVYVVWGDYRKDLLRRSTKSAEKHGYPSLVVKADDYPGKGFCKRVAWKDNLLFDTTLFLDADTQIMANIDYGFEQAERHGLACCIAPASMAYALAGNPLRNIHHRDMPQYNAGVVFVSRDHRRVEYVMGEYARLLEMYPQLQHNDQPAFSYAVHQYMNPYILPRNFNYRQNVRYEGQLFGELKILHAR